MERQIGKIVRVFTSCKTLTQLDNAWIWFWKIVPEKKDGTVDPKYHQLIKDVGHNYRRQYSKIVERVGEVYF